MRVSETWRLAVWVLEKIEIEFLITWEKFYDVTDVTMNCLSECDLYKWVFTVTYSYSNHL